ALALKLVLLDCEDLANEVVDVDRLLSTDIAPKQVAHAGDDLGRAAAVDRDAFDRVAHVAELRRRLREPEQRCVRARHHGADRLADLVRDRRRHRVNGDQTSLALAYPLQLGDLLAPQRRFTLGELLLGDIDKNSARLLRVARIETSPDADPVPVAAGRANT